MDEPKKPKRIYAPLGRRLVAFLLDGFLIVAPIAFVVGLFFGYDELKNPHPSPAMLVLEIFIIGFIFVFFWTRGGQTPGKKAMNLRIVDSKSFLPLSGTQAVIRYIAWTLCWTTLMMGFLVGLFNKKRRTLADFACGGCVIWEL